jgi:dTDP-4-dehydrorhamnose 3,5-epimerase
VKFVPQAIPEVILIKPTLHGDVRGYFTENFRQDLLQQAVGFPVHFIQENESRSSKGVLRGLHFQLPPYAQSKLVWVIEGSVLDVVVDVRAGSPTYGQYLSVELSAENRNQIWIPRGFAHGFVVLSEYATFTYKVDNYYAPEHDRGLSFADPDLNIDWQIPADALKLSEKDQQQPNLAQLPPSFQYGDDLYD